MGACHIQVRVFYIPESNEQILDNKQCQCHNRDSMWIRDQRHLRLAKKLDSPVERSTASFPHFG